MMLKNLLEGIAILSKYYDDPDEQNVGAEHDEFIMFPTDNGLNEEDYNTLVGLGWDQPDVENDDHDFDLYDLEESWVAPAAA